MTEVIKKYSNDDLTVVWQPSMCTHSAVCAKGLSKVFNPKARPWIDLQGSDSASIAAIVEKCPSGALSIDSDTSKVEQATEGDVLEPVAVVQVFKNGPMRVKGKVELTLPDGTQKMVSSPTLCRCGASANKPFCDGAHNEMGFEG
ncbi:MAG: putative Fe-S cluster protein YjdI [Saprospiraceae bacterium]|jgi:uncharacterized Fe-S cluster protein YjdI